MSTRPNTDHEPPIRAANIDGLLSRRGLDVPVSYAAVTESTQDDARTALTAGAPHGALFVAERQRRGRGRHGRRWQSGAGALLFSTVLRDAWTSGPEWPAVAAAVALLSAIEIETGVALEIKWPNDLVLGERKAAGVLIEAAGADAVLGVGLNVNDAPGIAAGVAAVSLAEIAGKRFDRAAVLAGALTRILQTVALPAAARGGVHAIWETRSAVRGRRVELSGVGWRRAGQVEGFGPNGELLLRTGDGALETIASGDVTLRTRPPD